MSAMWHAELGNFHKRGKRVRLAKGCRIRHLGDLSGKLPRAHLMELRPRRESLFQFVTSQAALCRP